MWFQKVYGWWYASLLLANSRLVSVTELCTFQIAPYLSCTHMRRKKLEYSNILCSRMFMNISSLVLRLGCMVYFSLNAVGALRSNVGMGGYPLVSEKCLY